MVAVKSAEQQQHATAAASSALNAAAVGKAVRAVRAELDADADFARVRLNPKKPSYATCICYLEEFITSEMGQ